MSYRAFKRLLGETSLERKCRFLFGAFSLLLITGSFWLYSYQTENLAYDQLRTTSRLLMIQIVDRDLATVCRQGRPVDRPAIVTTTAGMLASAQGSLVTAAALLAVPSLQPEDPIQKRFSDEEQKKITRALDEYRDIHFPDEDGKKKNPTDEEDKKKNQPGTLSSYSSRTLNPKALDKDYKDKVPSRNQTDDTYSLGPLKEFREDRNLKEHNRLTLADGYNRYYGAVRATHACLGCHRQPGSLWNSPDLQENDLIAVIKIDVKTKSIESDFHFNRALLFCVALLFAVAIMGGSYLIVRYVIVKPVKHLKEVSDAISAGELNVRSEIQTGDEFEDLSHAFNRMLRNLVNMQDRLRKVNADLDRKVDELAQANLALYESNRLKSDFLATMSHELRTPLNSILGFGEVLASTTGLTDKQQRWVGNIRSSGEQLLNLINDILDLAKIEAGKMQVRLVEFSSYDVCEGLLTMFRPLAEKKNIDLRGQLLPGIPVLRQDVVKFQQILSNLLSNAIKFTPEGGRVLLKVEMEGPAIVVTVTDTGVGIAQEDRELVFEKFRQSGNPLTREHAGTGLGLSIVRELCKLLGGEVTLQSELGRGSTFTVRLPVKLSAEPRLEFDLANEGVDLSKAQRVDVRLYLPERGVVEGTAPVLPGSKSG